ncbi:MAG: fructose-specific PTS transporter subunit EIIC, partial [Malacoplasma sp.]|nr:fructose-specific PTS transporter subunit EIIC [Malacoplasma sp.]
MVGTNQFFKKDLVIANKKFKSKIEALTFFAKLLERKKYAKNYSKVLDKVLEREDQFSTGIGNKIAIPHIRDDVMNQSVILFASVEPLEWNSIDSIKVEKIFFIAMSNKEGTNSHMDVIANLSRLFMNQEFVKDLNLVKDYQSLINLLDKYSESKKEVSNSSFKSSYDIVAITACPTGIAHTFMAAQMLEDTAKEMGIKIKVETQGTEGAKNVLTQNEIDNAKGAIIAVDKVVDLSRFAGKENVLEMGTKAVIKDARKEIQKILDNKGKKMPGTKLTTKNDDMNSEDLMSFKSFGKRMYKGIMNGVSYMLPFVIFGGILIALSFLIDIGNANTAGGNLGSVSPVAKWFNLLGNLSFGLMVPILSAYIAYGLVGKFGLLPGFICGLISAGQFVFQLDPATGTIDWLGTPKSSSGFFGGIAGAFLTSALIIVFVKYVFGNLPKSLNGIKNILFIPLFGTLIIAALFWIVNIPLIYVNYGFYKFLDIMGSNQYLAPLLGLVIGLMMAVDLGGPINKAAYLFSIATIESGTGTIAMAASMAGGMVPPLGIALSTSFFRKLWTQEERQTGVTLYIMGLSFVSEGAIPFTAKNPKVLLPANIIGGAITGLLVGALQITLQAPHGGIFVFALVKSSLFDTIDLQIGLGITLYIVTILAGAIASMLIIYFLSKWQKRKTKDSNNVENNNDKNKFSFKNIKKLSNIFKKIKIYKYDLYNHFCTINRLCY